jgi:hypothetical protein
VKILNQQTFFLSELSFFIPGIHLQGDQNPNGDQKNLSQSIGEVSCYPILGEQLMADFAEE